MALRLDYIHKDWIYRIKLCDLQMLYLVFRVLSASCNRYSPLKIIAANTFYFQFGMRSSDQQIYLIRSEQIKKTKTNRKTAHFYSLDTLNRYYVQVEGQICY